MRALVMIGLLVATALAGCAGGSENEDKLDDPDDVQFGHVGGVVVTDAGLLLKDARVFLVGTNFEHRTQASGTFHFHNVSAGKHTLRVEHSAFAAHEAPITVEVGETLMHNITMVPRDERGPGYRPHIHDYWAGRESVVLVDKEFDIGNMRVGTTTADMHPLLNEASARVLYSNHIYPHYWIPLESPGDDPPIVFPGAGRVEVTFTWDDSPPMPPQYAFGYEPANDNDEIELDPQGSPASWSVDVSPEMADNGHQQFSLWSFYIIPVNTATQPTSGYRPALTTENVHIKIEVFKGTEPPAEPEHPTFWQNGDTYTVRGPDAEPRSHAGTTAFGSYSAFYPDKERLVPPGASRLLVTLTVDYDQDAAPLDQDYVLYYNTAQYHREARPISQWDSASPVASSGGVFEFDIELTSEMTDAFYQSRSAWYFRAVPDGADPDGVDREHYRARTLDLEAYAVRDPGASIL